MFGYLGTGFLDFFRFLTTALLSADGTVGAELLLSVFGEFIDVDLKKEAKPHDFFTLPFWLCDDFFVPKATSVACAAAC